MTKLDKIIAVSAIVFFVVIGIMVSNFKVEPSRDQIQSEKLVDDVESSSSDVESSSSDFKSSSSDVESSTDDEFEERTKRLDPKWYRTKEGEAERLAAKTGDYEYPEKIMVTYKGLRYGFGKDMSTVDVMMKMGDPEEESRTGRVLVWYYDHSKLQFYFYDGWLQNIVEL